ncbi:hypothetical protein HAHE_30260 [Haloferula helveola]|uniref:Uncharacterized protein n=1 Tax=Haloferula helveola TaxID=490095 RepID=A0ABM7RP90_9BACT|nr:hypothetical protein HAHE_30260 [Haloferula helveola]
MSEHAPVSAVDSTHGQGGEIAECLKECLEHTVEAFSRAKLATGEEIQRLRTRFTSRQADDPPIDLVELLARLQGTEEERLGIEVARISAGVASVIPQAPPLIPFAGKLMAPSAFYEAYTQLHELSKALLSPVIYAEDTDAIGTGALNPIASMIMGHRILASVNRRFAIRPFVTAVRLDYESWAFLSRKHFGL